MKYFLPPDQEEAWHVPNLQKAFPNKKIRNILVVGEEDAAKERLKNVNFYNENHQQQQDDSNFNFEKQFTSDQNYRLSRLTKLSLSRPPQQTRIPLAAIDSTDPQAEEKYLNSMTDYFNAIHFDAHSDLETVHQYMAESLDMQRKCRNFDAFAGNRLCHVQTRRASFLACPASQSLNHLHLYKLSEMDRVAQVFNPTPAHVWKLKTPIDQITSVKRQKDACLLLRSMEGIHFYRKNKNSAVKYTFSLDVPAVHLASNYHLPSEASIMLSNGSVYLWDVQNQSQTCWKNGDNHVPTPSHDRKSWKTCEFGAHPRTILLADSNAVRLGDMRSRAENAKPIHLASNEHITSLARNEVHNPFHIGVATTKRTLLFDVRFPLTPLLEWTSADPNEHQNYLQFINGPDSQKSSGLCSWGKSRGQVVCHYYDQPDPSIPPLSKLEQKLPPFWSHPIHNTCSFDYMEYTSIPLAFARRLEYSEFPNLIGCALINNSDDQSKCTLFQMDEMGAMYSQAFSIGGDDDLDHTQLDTFLKDNEMKAVEEMVELNEQLFLQPDFEADNEVIDVENVVTFCQEKVLSMEDAPTLLFDDLELPNMTGIQSLFDIYSPFKLTFDESGSHLPPLNSTLSVMPHLENYIEKIQSQMAEGGSVIEPDEASIDSKLEALKEISPSMQIDNLDRQAVLDIWKSDLMLANCVIIPSKTKQIIEMDDGTHLGHKSDLETCLVGQSIPLTEDSSWLYDQWDREAQVVGYLSESEASLALSDSDGMSQASSSRKYIRRRRSTLDGSVRTGPPSVATPSIAPSIRSHSASQQPDLLSQQRQLSQRPTSSIPSILAGSQSQKSKGSQSFKRKRGF